MEYMTEQFDIDMRKVSLYSKNAYIEYEFAVEEAFLEGSPEDTDYIITEAAGNLIEKVTAVFKKIIEAIKKFFSGLIEKVTSFFSNNKEEKLKKAVQANPALAKQKVEVPDIKEIEAVCGKRAMLRKKMIAEYKAGKLTRDRFDELVEQNEKLGKRLKTVGVVAVAIGTIAAGVFTASKLIPKLKNSSKTTIEQVETIEDEAEKQVIEKVKQSKYKLNYSNPLNQKSYRHNDKHVDERQKNDDNLEAMTTSGLMSKSVNDALNPQNNQLVMRKELKQVEYPIMLVPGNEVAQVVTKSITEEERATLSAQLESINIAIDATQADYNSALSKVEELDKKHQRIQGNIDKNYAQKVARKIENNEPYYTIPKIGKKEQQQLNANSKARIAANREANEQYIKLNNLVKQKNDIKAKLK